MKHFVIILILTILTVLPLTAIETGNIELGEARENEILYLLEEEKLARDLYTVLADQWNLRIFSNIAQSEETHRKRIQDLADIYDLEYEVLPTGVFVLSEIQMLYDQLLISGLEGPTEALEAGYAVEVMDIEDLEQMLENDYPDDVVLALERLKAGSENHLAAFTKQLSR